MTSRIASCIAAAALALGAAAPAFADTVTNDYWLPLVDGSGLTQNASFYDAFATAGTDFVDNFYFNPPPAQSDVSFTFLTEYLDGQQEISFTGFTLTPFQPGETVVPIALDSVGTSFFGSGTTLSPLDSGIYVLQITGTTLIDGATFDGELNATVATVPEPADWALMAIGLGVVGAVLRRREQPAD